MEQEVWRNETRGRIGVVKYDRRGELIHELVRGGGVLSISTEERQLNQERAADEDLDVFSNGSFVPVKILDGTEDAKEIASNPNNKSETDLRDMFKLHWKKFEAEVGEIKNMTTLERLRSIAQEGDATVRQVDVIESRIAELNPNTATDVTLASYQPRA